MLDQHKHQLVVLLNRKCYLKIKKLQEFGFSNSDLFFFAVMLVVLGVGTVAAMEANRQQTNSIDPKPFFLYTYIVVICY